MTKRMLLSMAVAATALATGHAASAATDVTIGVLNDMSGLYADLSGQGSVVAAQMAVEDFKAKDKGINVKILSADHQNKPDVGSNTARRWIDEDGVDVIVDVPTSSVALAVNEVVREKNKIFINSGAATSDLTGSKCSPNTVHWTYDTWALAHGTGLATVQSGGKSWFFITADYAFGHALERDTAAVVKDAGGTVVGDVMVPLNTQDFSSYLLQAQGSGAQVIGLANAGGDTINSIKQASEFGITQAGQSLAGLLIFITDIHSLGLQTAQGLLLTSAFYWDLNDQTRSFAKRFSERVGGGKEPTMVHAGVYSGIMHYLKAVEAVGSDDTDKVMAKMKEMPIDDPLFGKGKVEANGRATHDMYLFRVKQPSQSKGPWDYYELVQTIPADKAFRPAGESGCPLVKG